jgi:small ligand-binding sensory domain FIST
MLTFGAAVSTAPDHQQALDEVIPAALDQLGGAPDLVVCFFSMEHAGAAAGIALSLSERTGTSAILGCTAQGVIGDGRELEGEPGLAVWMARLPGVEVRPFALQVLPLEDGVGIGGWPDLPADDRASVLLLADPFTFPADSFLERLNTEQPGLPVVGGMVSGALEPGRHRLLSGTEVLDGGAAGVALIGPVDIRAVVSQGCRPVGSPFAVRCWPAWTGTSRSCCAAAASRSARSSTSTRPASTGATSWSGACSGPTRRPARSPWPTASRSARPSSSTSATPTPPTRTSSCC